MKKISYLFSATLLFVAASTAMAQSTSTVEQEHQNKKKNEVQTQSIDKKQLKEKSENVTTLESREATKVKRAVDLESVEKSIKELETLIENNKNNPDFSIDAYTKRLDYLKELKASATEK